MKRLINVSSYPLDVQTKLDLYSHPQRKLHYGKNALVRAHKLLSEPIIKPGYDAAHYKQQIDKICDMLIAEADGCPRFIKDTLKCSIRWKLKKHPIDGKKENTRRDGTPILAHFFEPALRMAVFHADWDETIATIHHDDIEDGFVRNQKELYSVLVCQSKNEQREILANAICWHAQSLTNFYKTDLKKARLNSLEDWKDPRVFRYLKERMLAERLYLSHINSLEMLGPRIIKIFADRLHNLQSHAPLPKNITGELSAVIKGLMAINWAKKYSNATTVEFLRALRKKANLILEAYPNAEKILRVPAGWDVPFPIDIFSHIDYHSNKKSFEQDSRDVSLVDITGIRHELTPGVLRSLPYVGSSAAVIFAPEKQFYSRVDAHPIEIMVPRILREKLFTYDVKSHLLAEDAVKKIQSGLDYYHLPLKAQITPSLLPGKIGMDRIMLKLVYAGDYNSFVEYIDKSQNPHSTYEGILYEVYDLVYNYVESHFSSTKFLGVYPNKVQKEVLERNYRSILNRVSKDKD